MVMSIAIGVLSAMLNPGGLLAWLYAWLASLPAESCVGETMVLLGTLE